MATANININALAEQMQQMMIKLHESETKREEMERQIAAMSVPYLPDDEAFEDEALEDKATPDDDKDIITNITSGDQIQLDTFKVLPEFSGKQHEYRSWRNQVYRRMALIEKFKDHVKYEAALAIIRAKVTGMAADVLSNARTHFNINSILKTLDAAYTDQRPLYAIEAEMASIKQGDKNLQQYHYAINFALNAIISKIARTYTQEAEQRSLIIETQKKAIRTFIVGMKNRTMRHILYGHQPKTLSEAYSIAQTVYYDNEYLQLEQCPAPQRIQPRIQQQHKTPHFERHDQWNQPRHNHNPDTHKQWKQNNNNWGQNNNRVEPMEVDVSQRTKQTNWRIPQQQNNGLKREDNSFRHQLTQPRKMQRINQLTDEVQPIPDDLISNISNESTHTNNSSAFLEE